MAVEHFIKAKIQEDQASGKLAAGGLKTRFPPEPNGFLHMGHAKSICLNFGLAAEFQGQCHLRFDDTNPVKEDQQYVDAIQEDVRWLGFTWDRLCYASDYFPQLFDFALELIQNHKAYVCSLSAEEVRRDRGTLTEPGKNSPYRERSVAENLELFHAMKQGQFAEGTHILRAKIDMSAPNLNLRDPALYRIKKATHHRTHDEWCLYPMYDYAHALSDMLEGITHSLCTLEFEDHRPLYDWFLTTLKTPCHPQQIEFSRLNLDYTVMSKRKLLSLVSEQKVRGWDDPRLPTLQGLRRRGVTPAAIREFCVRVGVTKKENCIEVSTLEACIREDLDHTSSRTMAVLRPLRVVIENYPKGQVEQFSLPRHPLHAERGVRSVPFTREVWIEQEDFQEVPVSGFYRLAPGQEVRLRGAYCIRCVDFKKDPQTGVVSEVRCTYDPESHGGTKDGRKVKATLHWVSVAHAQEAEVRLYDRLFRVAMPGLGDIDFMTELNPASLEVLTHCKVEAHLLEAQPEARFQFERQGYFCVDRWDSKPEKLVLNRTISLKDSWLKQKK